MTAGEGREEKEVGAVGVGGGSQRQVRDVASDPVCQHPPPVDG